MSSTSSGTATMQAAVLVSDLARAVSLTSMSQAVRAKAPHAARDHAGEIGQGECRASAGRSAVLIEKVLTACSEVARSAAGLIDRFG